jgi:hypothetical protein
MRIVFFAVLCTLVLGGLVVTHAFQQKQSVSTTRTPVLVELFTSEGCSSCPPADKLAAEMQSRQPIPNAQVVLLAFHVDYWDQLGWKDRFSSHEYTLRQQHYSSLFSEDQIYTPEVIVDGKEARFERLPDEVRNAAGAQKSVALEVAPKSQRVVTISANGSANTNARLLVAIAEDGLSTKVGGGENGGTTLQHSGVVRRLASLGTWNGGTLTKEFTIPDDPQWDKSKLTLVAFAQDEKTGRVLGVTAQPLAAIAK